MSASSFFVVDILLGSKGKSTLVPSLVIVAVPKRRSCPPTVRDVTIVRRSGDETLASERGCWAASFRVRIGVGDGHHCLYYLSCNVTST